MNCSYHVRYLSHLALQIGSSNWVHKTQIHSIQTWRHFGANPLFSCKSSSNCFLYWIQYSWSWSTHILYYISLPVRWNTLLRNPVNTSFIIYFIICSNLFVSIVKFKLYPNQFCKKSWRGQEPTLEWNTWKVLHLDRLRPYPPNIRLD